MLAETPRCGALATGMIATGDMAVLQIFQFLLRKRQLVACAARSSLELVTLCNQAVPCLVIVHEALPKSGGIEPISWLRKFFPPERLPILYAADKAVTTGIVEAMSRGANDYITAPFNDDIFALKLAMLGCPGDHPG